MATEPSNLVEEDRLGEVLFASLQAVEAGESPDEVLARYPEFAAEIREFLLDRACFERLVVPLRDVLQPGSTQPALWESTPGKGPGRCAAALHRWLGDYELLEEIGRGGMGVVYKVRQRSLNRLVALKVVRPTELASEADVQRFRNEAEIVALLDHPGIVPVYEVGEQDGWLYFSMKRMEGGNLAEHLSRFRDDPRLAAQLVARIARAVHHAHQHGILHRDLKPSNILLDAEGQAYVTDFGLARRQEADTCLTLSGALVGTPSYMAPEQTSGKREAITTSADVYGLGAVLYAQLTGQPPFRGATVLETLEQVRWREPAPPRAINPHVDRDLETVCLKCLEKDPSRRYLSAEAVAEDLERWLNGEPIEARAVTRSGRARRWCRRNPLLVALWGAIALLLLLTVVGLAIGVWLLWWEQEETRKALGQAEVNYREVLRQQEQIQGREAQARAAQAAEKQARQRAQARLDLALQVLDQIYIDLTERNRPEQALTPADERTLDRALAFYEQIAREEDQDLEVRNKVARAYERVGRIHHYRHRLREAEFAYLRARELFEKLREEHPNAPSNEVSLGGIHHQLGNLRARAGRQREAEDSYRRAIALRGSLARSRPGRPDLWEHLADSFQGLAVLLAQRGQASKAAEVSHQVVTLLEKLDEDFPGRPGHRRVLASAQARRGAILAMIGRRGEAEKALRHASALQEGLLRDQPGDRDLRRDLAGSWGALANVLKEAGQPRAAETAYRQALAILEALVVEFPLGSVYRRQLVIEHFNLGALLRSLDRWREAETCARRQLAHALQLLDTFPTSPVYRKEVLDAQLQLGDMLQHMGRPNEALESYRAACRVAPGDPRPHNNLSWLLANCPDTALRDAEQAVVHAVGAVKRAPRDGFFWNTLGVAYYRAGQWEETLDALHRSVRLRGGDSFDFFFLGMAHWQRGDRDKASTWHARAVAWAEQHRPRDEELRRFRAEAEALMKKTPPATASTMKE